MSAIEQSVIGGLMLLGDPNSDQSQRVLSMLSPASFAEVDLSIAFAAIQRLAERNGSLDPFTVDAECKRDDRYREDLLDYLMEISANTPSAANTASYAHAVREASIERYAVSQLQQAVSEVSDASGGTIYQRLGRAESILSAIQERAQKGRAKGLKHAREVGKEWLAEVTDRIEGGNHRGFTLGIDALDRLLYPKRVPEGSLVVVGARPKMGKTGFMGRIVEHFAIDRKEAVAMFSLEMPESQIYERMLVSHSHVDPAMFYRPANDAEDWSNVTQAASKFNASQLHIDDTPGIRLSHVLRESRKLNRQHRVGLVAVDYLTLMEAEDAERNDLGYARITKGLKGLAKELNCVVLLLSQLNRGLETRPNKRPMPADSRDTGQIEQDCDLWIGLYRDAVYNDQSPEHLTEAIVRLNRHGKAGTVYFDLVDGTVRDVDQAWAANALQDENQKPTRVAY